MSNSSDDTPPAPPREAPFCQEEAADPTRFYYYLDSEKRVKRVDIHTGEEVDLRDFYVETYCRNKNSDEALKERQRRFSELIPLRAPDGSQVWVSGEAELAKLNEAGLCRKIELSFLLAEEIAERIAGGERVMNICKGPNMPTLSQFYLWRRRFPWFSEMLDAAREACADQLIESSLQIAEEVEPIKEEVNRARLHIDTYHKTARAWDKRRYGDTKHVTADVNSTSLHEQRIVLETGIRKPDDPGYVDVTAEIRRSQEALLKGDTRSVADISQIDEIEGPDDDGVGQHGDDL